LRKGPLPNRGEILSRVVSAKDLLEVNDENRSWRLPFEWKIKETDQIDIQFLEEPLVKTNYEDGSIETRKSGSLPNLPLARFFVWQDLASSNAGLSGYAPGIDLSQPSDLPIFKSVLHDLEEWAKVKSTRCEVPIGKTIHDSKAGWIIAGNNNLDPWLLSKALRHAGAADKVLWEWRPPYLPRRWKSDKSSILSSRPYTVIATTSNDFKTQLNKELETTLGFTNPSMFNALFDELGSRGVGIASLLSMGHQQSRGAIGFYLGFKLAGCWEEAAVAGETRMVLPLDAVNPVLESLAATKPVDDNKKADLLFISAIKDESDRYQLTLHPVEIKLHAAKQVSHKFPGSNSREVMNALGQLGNTRKVLSSFIETIGDGQRPVLINTTLASLVSTGLALDAKCRKDTAVHKSLVTAVATGECDFHLGTGALFWFERYGLGHDADPYLVRNPVALTGDNDAKVFIDPAECYGDILECGNSKLISNFLGAMGQDVSGKYEEQKENNSDDHGDLASSEEDSSKKGEDVKEEVVDVEQGRGVIVQEKHEDSEAQPRKEPELAKLSRKELEARYQSMIDTLEIYKVSVDKPTNVEPYTEGPASIMYRVKPATGVPPQKIDNNSQALKLELGLTSDQEIRTFIDQGCVVIDVPKKDEDRYFVDTTYLWKHWKRPENALSTPLGIDQHKNVVTLNFSSPNSPHLLIGGTTGSGKSEALNTILFGLTEHYAPTELRLLLVDPKGTEMIPFEDSEHLEGDIGWDDESAIEQLAMAVEEMQRRYVLFRQHKARGLTEYNAIVPAEEKLPWWLIVLDEYADLTSDKESKKKIEELFQRLAQKARAAGMHVIIATQKPSANVISTVVRSNIPAQLALKVKNATDSGIIMDEPGAESLNGKGDAFLKAEGILTRLQCARYVQKS
jgi:hypothetical protein